MRKSPRGLGTCPQAPVTPPRVTSIRTILPTTRFFMTVPPLRIVLGCRRPQSLAGRMRIQAVAGRCSFPRGIHAKRDKLPSIAYSEELIFSRSATLQSTDRHHGIVGQERCHFQLDS